MAVVWDCSKVADYATLHEDKLEWTKTEYLITFAGLFPGILSLIGIPSITEATVGEVFARLSLVQGLGGCFFRVDGKPYHYTLDDIVRRIGLTTNYSPVTLSTWLSKTVKLLVSDAAANHNDSIVAVFR